MARVCGHRRRDRRQRGLEGALGRRHLPGRVGEGRAGPRGRGTRSARRRDGDDQERDARGRRPAIRRGDRRRGKPDRQGRSGGERRVRHGLQGPSRGARHVRRQGRSRDGRRPLRRHHGAGEGRAGGQPAVRDQAVRRRELDEGARRRVHEGPPEGGDPVAAGDAPDPPGRVRSDRRGRRADPAGPVGNRGDDGHRGSAEPHLPDRRRHGVGDRADRDGRGRRLRALLHATRA